jgi:DNA-binding MarR family transcriptional regulator
MTAVNGESEMEMLHRPDGRKGIVMSKSYYERLRLFILAFLEDETGKTLNEILERTASFPHQQTGNEKSWVVLQVKLDLEARGLIKSFIPDYNRRMNLLRITRIGQKLLRQERVLAEVR